MVVQDGNMVIFFPTGGGLEGAVLMACLEEASTSTYSLSCPQYVAVGSWVPGEPDMDGLKAEVTGFHNAS